jgi:DNA-directed RNA polymerase alpha subunit
MKSELKHNILTMVEELEKKNKEIAEALASLKEIAKTISCEINIDFNPAYTIKMHDCNLSFRARGVLMDVGIHLLGQLCALSRSYFTRQRNCGKKTITELEQVMYKHGLCWGDTTYVEALSKGNEYE